MGKTKGSYCKAYLITKFREYKNWHENSENARKEKKTINGKEVEKPHKLTNNVFLYLQENYVVTDGIYLDENIIFDDVTDEWKEYCDNILKFEVPQHKPIEIKKNDQQK